MSISIRELTVAFHRKAVIEHLSLEIPKGCFFTLLGPSGCGKTTLLRTIAGFTMADSGTLMFGEQDMTACPAHRRDIGMVFQDYALFPDRSIFDNVAYGLKARGFNKGQIRPVVMAMLDHVGLAGLHERLPAALSGGQRQRVALARALVIKPHLLLMDEPLSNLDTKLRIQMRGTIGTLQREAGITTLFVTHDQEEALALSDLIGVMNNGKIEQVGTPQEIYRTPQTAFVANFVGGANILRLEPSLAVLQPGINQVQSMHGPLQARAQASLNGSVACAVIRPEEMGLSSHPVADQNNLPCVIANKHYLGHKTHYDVALQDGSLLVVHLSGPDHDCFEAGQNLHVTFRPERTLLVKA